MALPCMYAKKVGNPVLFSSLTQQALVDRACASFHRCMLFHVTYDVMGLPLSTQVLSCDLSHDHAAQVLFRINCPPPSRPVYGGGGISVGPATHTGLGTISMKVEWVPGAPPHLRTQTSFAGTY